MEEEKINGRELYFRTIHEVSASVNRHIQSQIKGLNLSGGLENALLELPKKREGKPIMRSNLTYLVYKNLGGKAEIGQIVHALALSELSNYHCYLDNWIFDNKNDCYSSLQKVSMITAASQIFRELAQKSIEEIHANDKVKRKISGRMLESTINCYDGQFQDFSTLTEKLSEFKSDDEFLRFYKNRSKLLSGCLYGLSAEIGARLTEVNEDLVGVSTEFGSLIGKVLHESNDLGDFALFTKDSSFKPYQDQFSDISLGRLTYPVYYALKYGSEKEQAALRNLMGNKTATFEEKKAASLAIISSGAYDRTIDILNFYRNELKRAVKAFPENEYRAALSSMTETVRHNKYLKALKACEEQK